MESELQPAPQSEWAKDIRAVFPDWQTDAVAERWPAIRATLSVGQAVTGEVISRAPFGVWLDIGVEQPALWLVVNMAGANDAPVPFDDYPQKGEILEARIHALGDDGEIGLTRRSPGDGEDFEPPR